MNAGTGVFACWILFVQLRDSECPLLEKIGVPDNKDLQTLSVLTEVCNADWGVLIAHADVTVLWHPWVGMTKEPIEVSDILPYYLLKDHH